MWYHDGRVQGLAVQSGGMAVVDVQTKRFATCFVNILQPVATFKLPLHSLSTLRRVDTSGITNSLISDSDRLTYYFENGKLDWSLTAVMLCLTFSININSFGCTPYSNKQYGRRDLSNEFSRAKKKSLVTDTAYA